MIVSIIQSFLRNLPVRDVRRTAKKVGIKGYSKLKKNDVIFNIVRLYAIKIIQRRYRKSKALNTLCPISLETICYPCWYKRTKKGRIYYNLEPLANFLITSGDFRDPNTRESYTEKEILSIDSLLRLNKIKISKSVKKAKDNPRYYKRLKENEEQIDILMERIRYIFWTIREHVEEIYNGYGDIKELTTQLDVTFFPTVKEYIRLLNRRDKRSLENSFYDMKRIITNIHYDCHVTKHLKNMIINWIDKEQKQYNEQ